MKIMMVIMMPMMIGMVTMMKKMTMQLVTAINQNTIMLCSILLKVNRSYVHAGGKCANESDSLGSQDHRGLTLIPTNFLQVLV